MVGKYQYIGKWQISCSMPNYTKLTSGSEKTNILKKMTEKFKIDRIFYFRLGLDYIISELR